MVSKETPLLNQELLRWLVAYFISGGVNKRGNIFMRLVETVKVRPEPVKLIYTLNEMVKDGFLVETIRPVYEAKSKHVYEIVYFEAIFSITKKGLSQLLANWEIAMSAISKEFYERIKNHLPAKKH